MSARTFLFLQGLASPFMYRLGRQLRADGHRVLRINISGADLAFWPEPAINFRGRPVEWPSFILRTLRAQRVSDVILFGDCRPLHQSAVTAARQLRIATHIFEEGYLRPNWVTLETAGTNGYSAIPRDPAGVRALAARIPEPAAPIEVGGSFFKRALWDVTANVVGAALWPMFPHYRWHGTDHPFLEYAGWLQRFARARARRRHTQATIARVVHGETPYYLMPLQLHSDYQIRVHSPYAHPIEAAEEVIESFAAHAPAGSQLLFKRHPLDNHLFDYNAEIGRIAVAVGAADRVHIVDDGDLPTLLRRSNGVVLVNSSIGTLALEHGCAVKALGTATYDMPGLTFQGSLNAFWTTPIAPDPDLYRTYRRVVIALTQVNGGFFEERAIEIGIRLAKERILANAAETPLLAAAARQAEAHASRAAPALDAGVVVPGE